MKVEKKQGDIVYFWNNVKTKLVKGTVVNINNYPHNKFRSYEIVTDEGFHFLQLE